MPGLLTGSPPPAPAASGQTATGSRLMGHPYRATQEWSRHLVATNWTTCDLAKPVIAQVQGYCLAGGTELASNLTESEAAARIAASRSTEFSLSKAANFMAQIRDEDRDEREWEQPLKAAVAAGDLTAETRGRTHVIRYGDLVDWEGEEVPLGPEWGYEAVGRAEPARNSASLRRVRTVLFLHVWREERRVNKIIECGRGDKPSAAPA